MQNTYLHVCILPVDISPAEKSSLIIIGHEGEFYMDEIPNYSNGNWDNNNNNSGENSDNNNDTNGGGEDDGPVGAFAGKNLGGLLDQN